MYLLFDKHVNEVQNIKHKNVAMNFEKQKYSYQTNISMQIGNNIKMTFIFN